MIICWQWGITGAPTSPTPTTPTPTCYPIPEGQLLSAGFSTGSVLTRGSIRGIVAARSGVMWFTDVGVKTPKRSLTVLASRELFTPSQVGGLLLKVSDR